MPKMEMTIPHHLSQEEALRRIKGLLERVKAEYPEAYSDLRESWSASGGEFAARIKGMDVSGYMAVTPTEVQLTGNVPFFALPFKSQIEDTIRAQAEQLLA